MGVRIAVIGSGSYGTCLAMLWGQKQHKVTLWCRDGARADEIQKSRVNSQYLPGFSLNEHVTVTSDLRACVADAEFIVGVTPSHAIREGLQKALPAFPKDALLVNASKGLEEGTLFRIDQIYDDVLPKEMSQRASFLSGPTFAKEVAAGFPAAIVIAGRDAAALSRVQEVLATDVFRVYTSDDVVGVQIGGALKNIIAVCAGISDGLGFGHNTRAALITRGLAEISRIGVALGAQPLTFAGLSGMGDLVLTCTGDLSRNRQVGVALGQGKKLDDITRSMNGMIAEGVKTTRAARDLAHKLGVAAPLTEYAYRVIYEGRPAREGIRDLMSRSLKAERD